MLNNKIIPDQSQAGNENRAHIHKAGRYNEMMPMTAEGGQARAPAANDIPDRLQGLCSANPLLDPHSRGRGHFESTTNKPNEIERSRYTAENRSRVFDYGHTNTKSRT